MMQWRQYLNGWSEQSVVPDSHPANVEYDTVEIEEHTLAKGWDTDEPIPIPPIAKGPFDVSINAPSSVKAGAFTGTGIRYKEGSSKEILEKKTPLGNLVQAFWTSGVQPFPWLMSLPLLPVDTFVVLIGQKPASLPPK
jgi:hypothetical protein